MSYQQHSTLNGAVLCETKVELRLFEVPHVCLHGPSSRRDIALKMEIKNSNTHIRRTSLPIDNWLWACVWILLCSIASCAPSEGDAVGWYQAEKADIDAFDQWLRQEVVRGLAQFEAGDTADFREACQVNYQELGAAGVSVNFAYNISDQQRPATQLCPGFGANGWSRDGVSAYVSSTELDGRRIGWGEYWDEGQDDHHPGFEVLWRFTHGEATIEVYLLIPRP